MMPRLETLATGRDNNFNLIRILAAGAVLVSHAWPIALGPGVAEPMERLTGESLGRLAVYVFFAISGFLIAASFQRARSTSDFLAARALRLFPGLAVSLLLVALVMGPLVTVLPPADYLTASETWRFVARNLTLVQPQYTLPGVFPTNPLPVVEGSIWTLIHEVACYALVFAAGLLGLLRRPRLAALALAAYALAWAAPQVLDLALPYRLAQWRFLSLPFVAGCALWIWRAHVPMSLVGVAGLGAWAPLSHGTALFFPALIAFVVYTTFWCAYVPRGALLRYNRLGDYSYGLYIYAFPIQGLVVWLAGPQGPAMNIVLSLPLTMAVSVLSWHLIEKPALALRHRSPRPSRAQPV